MSRAKLEVNIPNVEDIITGVVSASGNGAVIGIPKRYIDHKVKIVILKESGKDVKGFRE
ncbi:MAG: DUF2080 family transposase-associated protein [Candidatus Micrarchaeales archaeon]